MAMIEEGAWDVSVLKDAVRRNCGDDEREVENAVEIVEGCLRIDVERRWDVGRVVGCRFLEGFGDVDDGGRQGNEDRGL